MMQKIFFIFVLCVACVLAGSPPDFKLVNDTASSRPIIARTSSLTQPPPVNPSPGDPDYDENNRWAPALYWGNSFVIKNIRVQNDTESVVPGRKRLAPDAHFVIANQTIAMTGQEYLIRPRGYFAFSNSAGKRFNEQPPNGIFYNPQYPQLAAQALTVTPDYAVFRVTNTSAGDSAEIAFFDSETINSAGATFTLWASNPSALFWSGPGSTSFNASDPARAYDRTLPNDIIDIEWLSACRWIANGSDCGNATLVAPDVCSLVEFGLCWSRFAAPNADIETIVNGELERDSWTTGTIFAERSDNWSIHVAVRPLTITSWEDEDFAFPIYSDTGAPQVSSTVRPNQPSPAYSIALPMNSATTGPEEAEPFSPVGSTSNAFLRTFMPGKDNAGGTVEVTVRAIIEVPDGSVPNQVSRVVTHIQMVPSKVVLTAAQPSASVYFTNITKPAGVLEYVVHFLVTETSPSTAAVANSSAAAGTLSNAYPNGAYGIPVLVLTPKEYDFELKNFPPGTSSGAIQLPVTPEALFNCSAAGNSFVAQLATSPASVGQDSISLPFNITPPGSLKFWTCPSPGAKRQSTPTQITSFSFAGSNTAVMFFVTTQATPVSGVTVTFGTPVVTNAVLLDPVGGFNFAQNGTYNFDVVQNDVQVNVISSEAGDETSGPFVNQDFYMQFQWTPPTRNGFRIAISGLYTTFPSSSVISNNGTTGTFTVPAGATGFLAGPFRASSPQNLDPTLESFDIVYSLSLVPLASGNSDNTWYRLPSALQAVTVSRHRFAVINWDASENLQLFAAGQKSLPLCIAPAFIGALSLTDEIWLTPTLDDDEEPVNVIFEPVTPYAGVQPPNALRLTAANPVACFTARFDTNNQVTTVSTGDEQSITVYLSGPSASSFVDRVSVANMPLVEYWYPEIHLELSPPQYDIGTYLVGETFTVWVTIPMAPPEAFSYNLTLNGARIVPVSSDAGTFTPTGALTHTWQVTPYVLPVAEEGSSHEGDIPRDSWDATLRFWGTGPVEYYDWPATTISFVARQLNWIDLTEAVHIGESEPLSAFYLPQHVVNGLTVTPWIRASHGNVGGVTVTPSSFTFAPNSQAATVFVVTGLMLGTYEVGYTVSGPDRFLFQFPTMLSQTIIVEQHEAAALTLPEGSFVAGMRTQCSVLFGEGSSDDDYSITVDFGGDFVLSKTTFSIADGTRQFFEVTWLPDDTAIETDHLVFMTASGADAWKYQSVEPISVGTAVRTISMHFDESGEEDSKYLLGARYGGYVELNEGPAPEGMSLWFLAPNVQFFQPSAATPSNSPVLPFVVTFTGPSDGTRKYFEFSIPSAVPVTTTEVGADVVTDGFLLVPYLLDSNVVGNRFFAPPEPSSFGVRKRGLHVEVTANNLHDSIYMINRESPQYTVVAFPAPGTGLTVTLSHPAMTFNGGQATGVLTFGPGQLTASFSFAGTTLTHAHQIDVTLSGPDAELYDPLQLRDFMTSFTFIPELGFSPIPAIFTDGSAVGLKVWMVDALANGFNDLAENAFSLHVSRAGDDAAGTYFEPDAMHFSPSSLQNNRLSQEYSIHHVRPDLNQVNIYDLNWLLRVPTDLRDFDITDLVPWDARHVIVKRYQIIPEFPKRLNFRWQHASINLTRVPLAHMSLTPFGTMVDSDDQGQFTGASAGGRIAFDPPTVVFAPGQMVANFRVKAIPGNDQAEVYYRVLWQWNGLEADRVNYLDWFNSQPDTDHIPGTAFATWHVAASSVLQLSSLLLAAVLVVVLAL